MVEEKLPAISLAKTLMVLKPRDSVTRLDQLVVPLAITVHLPLMINSTCLTPDAFEKGSVAVPEKLITLLLTHRPLNGADTVTIGPLVSGWPPGASRRRTEPTEFEFALANAIR